MGDSDWNPSCGESSQSADDDEEAEKLSVKGEMVYGHFVEEDGQLRLKPGSVDEWLTKVQWAKWQYEEATRRNRLRREEQIASGTFDPNKKPTEKPKPTDISSMTPLQRDTFSRQEYKKAHSERLQWTRMELLLLKATKTLMEGLRPGYENIPGCISVLDKLYPIPFPADMLKKNPAIVEVLNEVKQHKNAELREGATKVFNRMRCMFAVPWGKPFMEEFFDTAEEYRQKTLEQRDEVMKQCALDQEVLPVKYVRGETEIDILWSVGVYKRKEDYSHLGGPFADEEWDKDKTYSDYLLADSEESSAEEAEPEEEEADQSDYLPSSPDHSDNNGGDDGDGGGAGAASQTGGQSTGGGNHGGNHGRPGGNHENDAVDRGNRENQSQGPEEQVEQPNITFEERKKKEKPLNTIAKKSKPRGKKYDELRQETELQQVQRTLETSRKCHAKVVSQTQEQPENKGIRPKKEKKPSSIEIRDGFQKSPPTLAAQIKQGFAAERDGERGVSRQGKEYRGLRTVKCIPSHMPRKRSRPSSSKGDSSDTKPQSVKPPQFENPCTEQEVARCLAALTTMCALVFDRESLEQNPQLVENILKASRSTNYQVKKLGAAIYVKFWKTLHEDDSLEQLCALAQGKGRKGAQVTRRGDRKPAVRRRRGSRKQAQKTNSDSQRDSHGPGWQKADVMTIDGIDIAEMAEYKEESDWWEKSEPEMKNGSSEQIQAVPDVGTRDSSTESCDDTDLTQIVQAIDKCEEIDLTQIPQSTDRCGDTDLAQIPQPSAECEEIDLTQIAQSTERCDDTDLTQIAQLTDKCEEVDLTQIPQSTDRCDDTDLTQIAQSTYKCEEIDLTQIPQPSRDRCDETDLTQIQQPGDKSAEIDLTQIPQPTDRCDDTHVTQIPQTIENLTLISIELANKGAQDISKEDNGQVDSEMATFPDVNKEGNQSDTESQEDPQPHTDSSSSPPLQIGDVVWAKLGRFPWWPAMVCLDPRSLLYYRAAKTGAEVHVQYFEEKPTRSWVKHRLIEPFRGLGAPEVKKGGKFFSKRKTIKQAVRLADRALKLHLDERLRVVLFNYNTKQGTGSNSTRYDMSTLLNQPPPSGDNPVEYTSISVWPPDPPHLTREDFPPSSSRVIDLQITDVLLRDSTSGLSICVKSVLDGIQGDRQENTETGWEADGEDEGDGGRKGEDIGGHGPNMGNQQNSIESKGKDRQKKKKRRDEVDTDDIRDQRRLSRRQRSRKGTERGLNNSKQRSVSADNITAETDVKEEVNFGQTLVEDVSADLGKRKKDLVDRREGEMRQSAEMVRGSSKQTRKSKRLASAKSRLLDTSSLEKVDVSGKFDVCESMELMTLNENSRKVTSLLKVSKTATKSLGRSEKSQKSVESVNDTIKYEERRDTVKISGKNNQKFAKMANIKPSSAKSRKSTTSAAESKSLKEQDDGIQLVDGSSDQNTYCSRLRSRQRVTDIQYPILDISTAKEVGNKNNTRVKSESVGVKENHGRSIVSTKDNNSSKSGKVKSRVTRRRRILKSKTKERFFQVVSRCFQNKSSKKMRGKDRKKTDGDENCHKNQLKGDQTSARSDRPSKSRIKTEPLQNRDFGDKGKDVNIKTEFITEEGSACINNGEKFMTLRSRSRTGRDLGKKGSISHKKPCRTCDEERLIEVEKQKTEIGNKRKGSAPRCPYRAGDLVWASLPHSPWWWPAIVCLDPVNLIYYRPRSPRKLHLHYFSQGPSMGWLEMGSIEPYHGSGSPGCQTGGRFYSEDPAQLQAMAEADTALQLSVAERLESSLVIYQPTGQRPIKSECCDIKDEVDADFTPTDEFSSIHIIQNTVANRKSQAITKRQTSGRSKQKHL